MLTNISRNKKKRIPINMKMVAAHKYPFFVASLIFAAAYRFLIIKAVFLVMPFLILFSILYSLSFYASVWSYRKYALANNSLRNIGVEIVGIITLYCLFPLSWMFSEHKPAYLIFSTFGVISTATFVTVLFFLKRLKYILWSIITFILPIIIHILLTGNDAENWVPFLEFVIPAWVIFNGIFFQIFFQKLIKDDNNKRENFLTETFSQAERTQM